MKKPPGVTGRWDTKDELFGKTLHNRLGCFSTSTHREDDSRSASDSVAASVDTILGGLVGLFVDDETAVGVCLNAGGCALDKRIRSGTDGDDDTVTGNGVEGFRILFSQI